MTPAGVPSAGGPAKEEAVVSAQVVTIPDTGNVRVSPELELGAGNIWPDKADGGEVLGAGLWILSRKQSPTRKHVRVRAGQELTEGGYRLKVLEIVKKPAGAYVRVQVQPGG